MELDFKWFLGIAGIAIGYFLTKFADRWFAKKDAVEEETTKLTLAMVELKIEIKHLTEKLSPMPKIQSDLNELHTKVRVLEGKPSRDG